MHIELIDLLRCPNKHDDSHLVAVFHRVENRDVIDATLGCPVCGAQFALRGGVALFGVPPGDSQSGGIAEEYPDSALRLAAYLDLISPGLTIVIAKRWSNALPELAIIAHPRVFGLTRRNEVKTTENAAWLQITDAIPLASNSVDGIALDEDFAQSGIISEAERVLRPGRRIVVPADTKLPNGFREIARDASWVVAERMPELIRLSR
jgi:uncharacterized protein YbaR (Trm112 family)